MVFIFLNWLETQGVWLNSFYGKSISILLQKEVDSSDKKTGPVKEENEDTCRALFWGLSLEVEEVHDRKLTTKRFDIKEAFNFYIYFILHLNYFMLQSVEILHIAKTPSHLINMTTCVYLLLN